MPFQKSNQKGLKPLLCGPSVSFKSSLKKKKRKPLHIFHQDGGMQVPRVVFEHFHGSPRFKREGIIFGTEGFSHFRVNRSGHGRHKKSERIELTTMLFFFNAPSLIPDGSHSHHFPLGSDKEKFWVPPVLCACLGYTKDFSLSLSHLGCA